MYYGTPSLVKHSQGQICFWAGNCHRARANKFVHVLNCELAVTEIAIQHIHTHTLSSVMVTLVQAAKRVYLHVLWHVCICVCWMLAFTCHVFQILCTFSSSLVYLIHAQLSKCRLSTSKSINRKKLPSIKLCKCTQTGSQQRRLKQYAKNNVFSPHVIFYLCDTIDREIFIVKNVWQSPSTTKIKPAKYFIPQINGVSL